MWEAGDLSATSSSSSPACTKKIGEDEKGKKTVEKM